MRGCGGLAVPMDGPLGYGLKYACDDCPFRRDAPQHRGIAASLPDYKEALEGGNLRHTCHKTDPRTDCPTAQGPPQHCYGAIIMGFRAEVEPEHVLQAQEAGELNLAVIDVDDQLFFKDIDEMVLHYRDTAEKLIERKRLEMARLNHGLCPKCGQIEGVCWSDFYTCGAPDEDALP